MKHLHAISRRPERAQALDIGAIFTLIADVLAAVATAVLAKENSQFPTIPTTET